MGKRGTSSWNRKTKLNKVVEENYRGFLLDTLIQNMLRQY